MFKRATVYARRAYARNINSRFPSKTSLERSHATAVLGGGPYTSVWIESPYEQVARVDAVRPIAGTEFDLLRLARPMDVSRAVTPLEIPVFHPTAGADHACYAVGRSDADDKTETAVLRPDAAGCDGANVCFAVSREPRSCSVRHLPYIFVFAGPRARLVAFRRIPVYSVIRFADETDPERYGLSTASRAPARVFCVRAQSVHWPRVQALADSPLK